MKLTSIINRISGIVALFISTLYSASDSYQIESTQGWILQSTFPAAALNDSHFNIRVLRTTLVTFQPTSVAKWDCLWVPVWLLLSNSWCTFSSSYALLLYSSAWQHLVRKPIVKRREETLTSQRLTILSIFELVSISQLTHLRLKQDEDGLVYDNFRSGLSQNF